MTAPAGRPACPPSAALSEAEWGELASRGGGTSRGGVGPGSGTVLRLRAALQPAALLQVFNDRLAEIPEFAAPLGRDLFPGRELAQTFVSDLQFIGCDGERNQAVLLHGRDCNDYPNSLPRDSLPVPQITDRMLG
jgi:hypothetical protein